LWIHVRPKDEKDSDDKLAALNLLMGIPLAVKHHLRGEEMLYSEEMQSLLGHIPQYEPEFGYTPKHLPLELVAHLHTYIRYCLSKECIDGHTNNGLMNVINTLVENIGALERIRNTPVPDAYTIHLKQTLTLYLLSLPFQLLSEMKWVTVVVSFFASFTFLGIEAIGEEIENPFGYDPNDLDMDSFCDALRQEILDVIEMPMSDPSDWNVPGDMRAMAYTEHTLEDL
jgi:putative membrane protein